ncbi:hypothetical protein [Enterovibrio coralii]|uniref:DUF4405 domain-containing protein n=1 Tax=Enterovibrio coralii TaxID=294935 RepID=A0A135ICH1_9GAMM|nr:hypothetical protein [Enterovibrio coralii]KXF83160.1 hypothetical protein ATN88_05520 [Enterovibrio coralii]
MAIAKSIQKTASLDRAFASITMLVSFSGLSVTAFLMLNFDYSAPISTAHICFSLLFVSSLVLHLINNLPMLSHYWFKAKGPTLQLSLLFVSAITAGAALQVVPFKLLFEYEQSSKLDGQQRQINEVLKYDLLRYQHSITPTLIGDQSGKHQININLSVKQRLRDHLAAIWFEDEQGNVVQLLAQTVKGPYNDEQHIQQLLPHLHSKLGDVDPTSFMPLRGAENALVLSTTSNFDPKAHTLVMEYNAIGDSNRDYRAKRRGSVSEKDGQPSVVYHAELNSEVQWMLFSGQTNENGDLIDSRQKLTTVLEDFQQILVEVVSS